MRHSSLKTTLLFVLLLLPSRIGAQCHVDIGGELRQRILHNFDRLEQEKYRPEHVYLTEEQSGYWPGDTEGRTILGLVLDARSTGRQPLYLDEILRLLPSHLNAKGYLGTIHKGQADEQQLSGHGWLLRGLSEYYLWKHDTKALQLLRTITDSLFLPIEPYLKSYPLDPEKRIKNVGGASGNIVAAANHWRLSTDVGCIFIAMDGFLQATQVLNEAHIKGEAQRLRMAKEWTDLFLQCPLVKIEAQTHASLTGMRGLLRYAAMTGDKAYVTQAEHRWKAYKQYGMTEDYANYNWFCRYNTWTEPCAVVDSYMVASQLWQATRKAQYLTDAELIYWNALCHGQRDNGGFGTDNCPGKASGSDCIGVAAYEAHWCCTMRGGEGLSRAAEYAAYAVADTLFLTTFRDMTVRAQLASGGLTLTVSTLYPFQEDACIDLYVKDAPSKTVLAVPAFDWMTSPTVKVNGRALTWKKNHGMVTFSKRFRRGDHIKLTFTMHPQYVGVVNPANNTSETFRVTFGPLLLAAESCQGNLLYGEKLNSIGKLTFRGERSSTEVSPLYHLMSTKLKENSYARRLLFHR